MNMAITLGAASRASVGAIGAALALRALFPVAGTLGETAPVGGAGQSFGLEVLLTTMLIVVIFRVSTGAKEKGVMAGAAIGAVVGLEALFGGPISGASMNPARSLGPALVGGQLGALWIYITAPLLAAPVSVLLERSVMPERSG